MLTSAKPRSCWAQISSSEDGADWTRIPNQRGAGGADHLSALPHGVDFTEEAQGYVLTIDQKPLFEEGGLFSSLVVDPLAIGPEGVLDMRARIEPLLQNRFAETSWPREGHALMLD